MIISLKKMRLNLKLCNSKDKYFKKLKYSTCS
nr:MAG TPA: hypothetical protein [Caudoviricetes sp.]